MKLCLATALLAGLFSWTAAAQTTAARVRAEAESHLRPCLVQAADERAWCERQRVEFVNDFLRARAGDYQGQRNVAWMLGGREAAVRGDGIQSCAWRLVIMSAGHTRVSDGDNSNLRTDCGRLDQTALQAARIRAQQLHQLIATDPVRNPPVREAARRPAGPLDGTASPLAADPPRQR